MEQLYYEVVDGQRGGQVAAITAQLPMYPKKLCKSCGKWIKITAFRGYETDNGIPDGAGKKWQLFIKCPHCTTHNHITDMMKELKEVAPQKKPDVIPRPRMTKDKPRPSG